MNAVCIKKTVEDIANNKFIYSYEQQSRDSSSCISTQNKRLQSLRTVGIGVLHEHTAVILLGQVEVLANVAHYHGEAQSLFPHNNDS